MALHQEEINRIADEIVALVDRVGGPVTLYRIDREVPGFAASEPPSRNILRELGDEVAVLWDGHVRGCLSGAPHRASSEQGGH
jgi:hypothetical protein